jgi:hypothetical protein
MRMRWTLPVLVAVGMSALLLAAAGGVGAEGAAESRVSPVLGGDFIISDLGATSDEQIPTVAYSSTRNVFLVVWADYRDGPSSGQVFGRWVSGRGRPIGGAFQISGDATSFNNVNPSLAVAYNSAADEFIVVWQDARHVTTRGLDIYGRLVTGPGSMGAEFRISGDQAIAHEQEVAVTYDATRNRYLVVWRDTRNVLTTWVDIYGQRLTPSGSRIGTDFRISDDSSGDEDSRPSIAWSAGNGYLVVWQACCPWRVSGRRVSGIGSPIGASFSISGDGFSEAFFPQIISNQAAGEYLVVWRGWLGGSKRVYGRRVSGTGSPLGALILIGGVLQDLHEWAPTVAWNALDGEYAVAWEDGRALTARGWDIFGRQLSASGVPFGSSFRVSGPYATDSEFSPAIAWNAVRNEYLIVWSDHRIFASHGWDIYGRRIKG